MQADPRPIGEIFSGWDSHQQCLLRAVSALTPEQLEFRPAEGMRSAGETARMIADVRLAWSRRTFGEDDRLTSQIAAEQPQGSTSRDLANWLESTWWLIERMLSEWTRADLDKTFMQPYEGTTFLVPHQWVLWRLLSHEFNRGGELATNLMLQGIAVPDLYEHAGHTVPLRAKR